MTPCRTHRIPALALVAACAILAGCEKGSEPRTAAPKVAIGQRAPVPQEMVRQGARIFADNCIPCHSIEGAGGTVGPDLSGVAGKRDAEYIRKQLTDPKSHNKESVMPSFAHMTEEERNAVIGYLMTIYMLKAR